MPGIIFLENGFDATEWLFKNLKKKYEKRKSSFFLSRILPDSTKKFNDLLHRMAKDGIFGRDVTLHDEERWWE